jgi:phosphoribosylaminoimidazole-succinocarboxamide synthase
LLKFLFNLFKKEKNVKRHFHKFLTYTYKDEDNNFITKTIENVEVIIRETSYGHSCNVLCSQELQKEEVMAIVRMFL